jgi:trans-2,3-dihydro-3-hydroxyanthranilate isomerase
VDARAARWHVLERGVTDDAANMKSYSYRLLDVFTNVPFGGNPLAVFTDARGLTDPQMQGIARELNLSETTFVLPPRDRSHHSWVRIFSPLAELPSSGFPTIGTAYALSLEERLRQEALKQRVVFEDATGPVSVTMESPMITIKQPTPEFGPLFGEREAVAAMLGLESSSLAVGLPLQSMSAGVPYLVVPLSNLEATERIRFRQDIWERVLRRSPHPHVVTVTLECRYPDASVHCRVFAPALGINEDPATSTAAGPVAAYLAQYGVLGGEPRASVVCEQGIEIGRPSFIHVTLERPQAGVMSIRVGGQCVAVGQGQIFLE